MFAYIGLGSNLGDRKTLLTRALAALDQAHGVRVARISPFYDTAPLGPQNQGRFLNAAAELETTLDPRALLNTMQTVEAALGREPAPERPKWGPRLIDLDLLLFGNQVIEEPGLNVPHPGIPDRWFVLRPLADLVPDLRHPTTGQTIARMLAAVDAPSPALSEPQTS